jgi:hypothetical protein
MDFKIMYRDMNNQILNSIQFIISALLTVSLGGMYAALDFFSNVELTFGDKYFLFWFFFNMLSSALFVAFLLIKYLELPHLFGAEFVAINDPQIKNLQEPTNIVNALIRNRLNEIKDYFVISISFQIFASLFALIIIIFV